MHDSASHCVATMSGAVPHTSTRALADVTLPYVIALVDNGFRRVVGDGPGLAEGVNAVQAGFAKARGVRHVPPAQL